ncbi:MAG: ribose-5-phosphate isomerase RpiA [Myxococcales bacterium]
MNVDEQRRAAGEAAAALVRDGMALGYGTGRAAAAALEALARRKLRVRGVPTSERTAALCRDLGLALTTLEETPELDLCIDGADEIDPRNQALKGGGGAMVREKLVALAAHRRVLVIEEAKLVPWLGSTRGLPIAVLAFGWSSTLRRVAQLLPGAARRAELNDDGNVVLDAPMPPGADLQGVAHALKGIAGVVDHGLFLDLSPEVLVGTPQGVRSL